MSKNTDLGSLVNYIKGQVTGRLNAPAYTSATAFTGTIAGYLGFDTSGNILTSAGVGFTGSGTTNYIPKFTGSTALGNSAITDDGTTVTLVSRALSGTSAAFSDNLTLTNAVDVGLILNVNNVPFIKFNIISGVQKNWGIASTNIAIGDFGIYQSTSIGGNPLTGTAALYFNSARAATFISSVKATSFNAETQNIFSVDGSERMRIDSSGRLGLGTTSTSGYAMTVTGVDGTNFSPSALYKITTKFVNNTSENKGIGIGYHTNADVNTACIYSLSQGSAAFPQSGIAFGVYNYSTSAYVIKFLITENTVKITNIPTSASGLGTGDLWRDGDTVKIAT